MRFIKGQKIQRLGYIMRRAENQTVRQALEWKLHGIKPGRRPRKNRIDVLEEDLKSLGVEAVKDGYSWRSAVTVAKTLLMVDTPEE